MKSVLSAAAAAVALACALPAGATVVYQSIPDLSASAAVYALCSTCNFLAPQHQFAGQTFNLGAAATVRSLTLAINRGSNATPITVGIYLNSGGVLANQIYSQSFAGFATDTPGYDGIFFNEKTDIVGLNLGDVALAAGNYVVMFSSAFEFLVPAFDTGTGHGIVDTEADYPLAPGGLLIPINFGANNLDLGVTLSDTAIGGANGGVPEPATWALMIGGFGLAGAALRRRRGVAAAA
ncbi:PEPxxWA-CTERM sorting domain-containing protein [Phenylobacterium sp.]|uniref:PEPxxWA-CTERM sorting domain-containing protein n=1 Tax=Phenylobacterium sp. TaxID=1871053 RepID=UPI00374D1686